MYDTKNDLAAYKFSGLHICFILEDSTYSEDEVDKMANEVQKDGEGKVEEAESGGQVDITLDESRGKVDKSILNEKMLDFCKAHEIYWAIARQGAQPAAENGAANSRQKRELCYRYYCYWYRYLRSYRRVCRIYRWHCTAAGSSPSPGPPHIQHPPTDNSTDTGTGKVTGDTGPGSPQSTVTGGPRHGTDTDVRHYPNTGNPRHSYPGNLKHENSE
ncbi:uncharacterized protein [Branchiostoma lanceolatum]|uniref:uncharacterized protein n=1 Tax=Branchiostoma lanceolatum TaxID=7740 RepID=UPI003454CB2F